MTLGKEKAEVELGRGMTLLGGFEIPAPRLDVIVLGGGVALLSSFEVPFPRLDVVLGTAVAALVKQTEDSACSH